MPSRRFDRFALNRFKNESARIIRKPNPANSGNRKATAAMINIQKNRPPGEKVIVLDFVSDIRRFAAGLSLKDKLDEEEGPRPGRPIRLRLPSKVSFKRVGEDDPQSESFLRQWLEDIAAIESAGEDTSILKYPPSFQ